MVLIASSKNLRKRDVNGATPALLKPRCEKCTSQSMTARIFGFQRATLLHKAYLEKCLYTGDESTCSPSEKKHQTAIDDTKLYFALGKKETKAETLTLIRK